MSLSHRDKTTSTLPGRDLWQSSPCILDFVEHGQLDADADTETIALNLIDHMLLPQNWDPRLSLNVLSTTCFYLASRLTGKGNTLEQIAGAVRIDPAFVSLVAMSYGWELGRAMEMLRVRPEDIRRGCGVLLSRREELKGCVGTFEGMQGEQSDEDTCGLLSWEETVPVEDVVSENVVEQTEVKEDDLLSFHDSDNDEHKSLYAAVPNEKASEVELDNLAFDIDDTDPWY